MTTQQPEALRLADICAKKGLFAVEDELRRLHTESEQHLQELRSYRITVENREARIAELEKQLIAEAARTAEQKLRAAQLEQQHAMQAKMHSQAAEKLAAAQPAAHWMVALLRKEIENITRLLPANVDCSGVWAALDAAQAKQGEK